MYRKGDRVTLKTNLVRKKYYGILPYFEDLEVWQGRVMTIQKSYIKEDYNMYLVNENNRTWAEGMLMKELLFDCEGCTETDFPDNELTDCKECGRSCCEDCIIDGIYLCLDCAKQDRGDD